MSKQEEKKPSSEDSFHLNINCFAEGGASQKEKKPVEPDKKVLQNLIIRRMTLADIESVLEIENLCFSHPWSKSAFESELSGMNPCVYNVIEDASTGNLCAYMGVWYIFDEGHITNVAVHPEYRGLGAGSLLVSHTIKEGMENGLTAFTLEVRKSNETAKALYEKFGFKPAGVRKNYYENNEDAIIMWLYKN